MATIRVGSVLLVVGCCATACGAPDDTPARDTDVTGGAGSANAPPTGGAVAATGGVLAGTGGAVATTGGDSATGGVLPGAGGAATGGTATGGTATGGAATGGQATGGAAAGGAVSGGAETGGAETGGAETGGAATGGATTDDADCFPPITDFAATDGGFSSAERERVQIGTGDEVSLFRPSDASFGQNGCQHPLLVWGNGSTNTVDIWASHLSRVATFGFVVVAPEQTQVNSGHMNDALDYVIGLSQDSSSAYYNKVDISKLGATGYSLGGMGAMQVAADPRIGATFIWDSFGTASALHGPLGGIFAESGIGGGWADMIDSCPYPAFGMEAAGTDHTSVLGYPGGFGGVGGPTPYAQEAYVAWFRWHFMGDSAAETLFAGDSCGFCTRDGITVHTSGIN